MCREVSYEGRIEGSCPWESNACCDPEYVHLTSQMSRGLLDVIAHITNSGQLGPRLQLCTRSAAELAMKAERKRGGFGQAERKRTCRVLRSAVRCEGLLVYGRMREGNCYISLALSRVETGFVRSCAT